MNRPRGHRQGLLAPRSSGRICPSGNARSRFAFSRRIRDGPHCASALTCRRHGCGAGLWRVSSSGDPLKWWRRDLWSRHAPAVKPSARRAKAQGRLQHGRSRCATMTEVDWQHKKFGGVPRPGRDGLGLIAKNCEELRRIAPMTEVERGLEKLGVSRTSTMPGPPAARSKVSPRPADFHVGAPFCSIYVPPRHIIKTMCARMGQFAMQCSVTAHLQIVRISRIG